MHRHLFYGVMIYILLSCGAGWANPASVIIIRHAEKAGGGLSKEGEERAQALVHYFTEKPMLTKVGLPMAIYAFEPQADGRQARGVETITPLADKIHVEINATFSEEQVSSLVNQIMTDQSYDKQVVLICWEHHHIPLMAKAFGVQDAPNWPNKVYDRTWVIHFDSSGKVVAFENLQQHLLPGDS